MKYIALLRGINVGGKAIIKMSDLKSLFEKNGLTNVSTYINSGNVIFESSLKDGNRISEMLEKVISDTLKAGSCVIVLPVKDIFKIISDVPPEWKKRNNLRCYIAFIRKPVTTGDVLKVINPKSGVDSVKAGREVLYLSTDLEGLTRSGFSKLVGTEVYKSVTIRNYNTVQKLLKLVS